MVPFRSEHAFGVPPYDCSGPTELFYRLERSCGTQLGTLYFYAYPSPIMSRLWWCRSSKEVLPYKPTLS